MRNWLKKYDKHLALILAAVTVALTLLVCLHDDWRHTLFLRHRNPISWYIRPLLLIPCCYAAWRRTCAGIMASLLLLLSSMAWFPAPDAAAVANSAFLAWEEQLLGGGNPALLTALALLVPACLALSAITFWRRSLRSGILCLILIAAAKITGSIHLAGASGKSIILPALTGLIACVAALSLLRRPPSS